MEGKYDFLEGKWHDSKLFQLRSSLRTSLNHHTILFEGSLVVLARTRTPNLLIILINHLISTLSQHHKNIPRKMLINVLCLLISVVPTQDHEAWPQCKVPFFKTTS